MTEEQINQILLLEYKQKEIDQMSEQDQIEIAQEIHSKLEIGRLDDRMLQDLGHFG